MPGQGKYPSVYDKLPEKKPVLERLFRSSPQYDGSYTHDKMIEIARAKLTPSVQQGDPMFTPAVSLDFSGAPNFNDVQVGGGGLPSTPYTPNPASPGAGEGADPTKQPDAGLTPNDIKPNFVPNQGSVLEPAGASANNASTVLGQPLVMGQGPRP